jgi:hypothetical protein
MDRALTMVRLANAGKTGNPGKSPEVHEHWKPGKRPELQKH